MDEIKINSVDLSIGFPVNRYSYNFIRNFFGMDTIGFKDNTIVNNSKKFIVEEKIYSTKSQNYNFFLNHKDFFGDIGVNMSSIDIITVRNFNNFKKLLKMQSGKHVGFEFLLSNMRSYENPKLAKLLYDLKYIHNICEKNNHQFILSSGAYSMFDIVPKKSLNAILEKIGISSTRYWINLNKWLYIKKREFIYDP